MAALPLFWRRPLGNRFATSIPSWHAPKPPFLCHFVPKIVSLSAFVKRDVKPDSPCEKRLAPGFGAALSSMSHGGGEDRGLVCCFGFFAGLEREADQRLALV
jgi:hypothetical protein